MLPKIAKKATDALIAEAQDAQYKLELIPTSTLEFVDSLSFLDEIQERVGFMSVLSLENNDCVTCFFMILKSEVVVLV